MTPPSQNQVALRIKGALSEPSSSIGLHIIFSKEDWRDPTPKEKRDADAMCSGVASNEFAKLLRWLKSFAEEHDTEPDDDATNRFVIGIMRMLNDGRLVPVEPQIGQGESSFALLPGNGNVSSQLAMTSGQVIRLSNDDLNLDKFLASCRNYHRGGSQSDSSSTLASEDGAPEGFRKLKDRLETIECNCHGDCHHMDKPRCVLTGPPVPTDTEIEYQDERMGGRLVAIMRTMVDCFMSIFDKIPVFRTGGQQQDVERNTATKTTGNRDRS